MQTKNSIHQSDLKINQETSTKDFLSPLALKILELDHSIVTNYPKLPPSGESYKTKAHRSLIGDIQVRLAEISAMIRFIDFSSYPNPFENCSDLQKFELGRFFNTTKILSLAIIHKLNFNKIDKAIPDTSVLILQSLCNQCFFMEENIKNQEITQAKIEQLSKGLCNSASYECMLGFKISMSPGFYPGQVSRLTQGTPEQLSTLLSLITERRKQLDYSYKPTGDQINFLHVKDSNVTQMFKGIFSNAPTIDFNKFINDVSIYIKSYPRKKAFLESINNRDYEQALRRCCSVGDIYLASLLIDYVSKDGIKLKLNKASSDGKTAHHLAAIYANKTGDLACLQKLFDYTFEQSVSYDLSKDLDQKTFENYLNETNRETFESYQMLKFNDILENFNLS